MTTRSMLVAALLLAGSTEIAGQPGQPTPAGYWEGTVSTREIPMTDTGRRSDLVVTKIPMTPFSPFRDAPVRGSRRR